MKTEILIQIYFLLINNSRHIKEHAETRNKKLTVTIFLVCSCYVVCTTPHVMYGYVWQNYNVYGDKIYNFTLGLFWLQYAFNICIYIAQKDQYWRAYKDYLKEVILPKFGFNSGQTCIIVESSSSATSPKYNHTKFGYNSGQTSIIVESS